MESQLAALTKVERGRYSLDPTIDPCLCVKVHAPKLFLTERHHIMPLEYGGPDEADNWVTLCPTGHYIVHYHFLGPWLAQPAGFVPPTHHARYENPFLFAVALEGWRRIFGQPWSPIPAGR